MAVAVFRRGTRAGAERDRPLPKRLNLQIPTCKQLIPVISRVLDVLSVRQQ